MIKIKKPLISLVIFSLIWIFASVVYLQLMPNVGGMTYETQPIFWMQVFIAGEIAVCTYLLISALKGFQHEDPKNN